MSKGKLSIHLDTKTITRLFPVILCLLPLLLTACDLFSGQQTPLVKAPRNKQVYTVPEVDIPASYTLDPALAHDAASIRAVQMVFTGLFYLDANHMIQPQLAETWQRGADGVTWTFHLKAHLRFSDGTPLTASDIAYSLDRALQPATQSTVAYLYLHLIKDADQLYNGSIKTLLGDSLLAPNDTTLIIITRSNAAYFPSILASTCAYVVEKSIVTKYGKNFIDHLAEGSGGAGPFKIAHYSRGKSIDFVPDPYYQPQPQLQHVTFAFYHSADETYRAYRSNMLDMTAVPLSTLTADKQRKDFFQVPQLWTNYYTMNYLVKPFDNIHIRQAFALAIDKTAIASSVWQGTVIPTNHIIPDGMPGYNKQLTGPDGTQGLTGNAAMAQKLLKQGLQEEHWASVSQLPAITLTYATDMANEKQEVTAIVKMWQHVLNITVNTSGVRYDTLLDQVTASTGNVNGLQCWGFSWVGEYADAQNWLSYQFGSGVPDNNMNYGQSTSQQLVQQQLAQADTLIDTTMRLQQYQQAEQQLIKDVAWMPLEQISQVFLRSPLIVGIGSDEYIPPNNWANIYRVQ